MFREPDGWRTGGVWIAIGFFFFGIYGYYNVVHDGGTSSALHFGVLWVLIGVPELLPKDRRHITGGLRIVGLAFAVSLIIFYLSRLSIFQ